MRLGQIRSGNAVTAAIFEGESARPIPSHTMCDLIRRAEAESISLHELAGTLASRLAEPATPIAPIHPSEVWACGCTYEMSASFRDAEHGTREGMYAYVYREQRISHIRTPFRRHSTARLFVERRSIPCRPEPGRRLQ